ncbi:MAG: hypothetical protein AAFO07_09325 [Bacteroidota bacterium]
MANFNWDSIPQRIAVRILHFLNSVKDVKDITESELLKDDPNSGSKSDNEKGIVIGDKVAQSIINLRNNLPARRFRHISQLEEVKGLGKDKINDLIYSFDIKADDAFIDLLRSTNTLMENWTLTPHYFQLRQPHFSQLIKSPLALQEWVSQQVRQIVAKRHENYMLQILAEDHLKKCYIDHFEDAHYGAIAFAFWFYHFDADNWFSFERMRTHCETYLNHYPNAEQGLELILYKGFHTGGLLTKGITPKDLPVVINRAEESITIWAIELFD